MKRKAAYTILVSLVFCGLAPMTITAEDKAALREEIIRLVEPVEKYQIIFESFVPSPDSQHVACVARSGKKFVVMHDGKAQKEYHSIAKETPVFSPDSQHMAYKAQEGI
ncbi:MAG: hypothetical protein WAP34_03775, partial [Desulfomonilia bacterium]